MSLGVIILLCIFCAICYYIKNKKRQGNNSQQGGGYNLENGKYKNRLSKPKHTSTPVHKSKASILDDNDDDDEKLIPNENGLVSDPLLANQEKPQQNLGNKHALKIYY